MVTINLTLFINLALFLIFIWAMNVFIFKPLLELTDRRESKIANDQKSAIHLTNQAEDLERQYFSDIAAIHREASHTLVRAHRSAQEAHMARLDEVKIKYHRELAEIRAQVKKTIASERASHPELAAELVDIMAERIELERNSV